MFQKYSDIDLLVLATDTRINSLDRAQTTLFLDTAAPNLMDERKSQRFRRAKAVILDE